MPPKALQVSLALFCATVILRAQPPFSPLPNGIVGVPYSTDLGDGLGNVPQIPGLQVSYNLLPCKRNPAPRFDAVCSAAYQPMLAHLHLVLISPLIPACRARRSPSRCRFA